MVVGCGSPVWRREITLILGGKAKGWRTLYSWRASLAWERLASGVHESSSAEYPFHWIRKEQFQGVPRWRKIWSISYSSSPAIRSGGGFGKFRLCTVFSR